MAWWDDEPQGASSDDPYYALAGPGALPDPWDVAASELDEVEARACAAEKCSDLIEDFLTYRALAGR